MAFRRPDPDALLQELRRENPDVVRGRLKVFLGASAGVGKTYAMLSEAHEQKSRGLDVAAGWIETHGREDTQALVSGLEVLPRRQVHYKGVVLEEFDVDGAVARSPGLILVDELAHTNAPGGRHPKRWQDVEELLDAGISVYTAVNIQHLESLNDAVAQITGVKVAETVPDSFVERADDIEVIDIPPEELRQRLREGRVYIPERIEHALEGFFKSSNLMALRELALRKAADRVDEQMRQMRSGQGVERVWPARERLLVCIAPSSLASRVVRAAARLAASSHAEVLALYVESDRQEARPPARQELARQALRLAESLGMKTATLGGHDIAGEILAYARRQNVSLIVAGKPIRPRWREILFGSVVDELVRRSGEIDVQVVTGSQESQDRDRSARPARAPWSLPRSAAALAAVASAVVLDFFLDRMGASEANLIMLLLLAVAFVASQFGAGEVIFSAVASILAFNFLFVEPRYTFAVSDTQYLFTFVVMLGVALLISSLTLRLRARTAASAARERRTAALFHLSRQMAGSRSKDEISRAASREIGEVFEAEAAVMLVSDDGLKPAASSSSRFEEDPSEAGVALWSLDHAQPAGKGTDTLAGSRGFYLPLQASRRPLGVLALLPSERQWPLAPAMLNLLETFANSLAVALERAQLAREYHEAKLAAESEKMRNALLSSISHDLRTPLTSISGAASALVAQGAGDLASTIYHESIRLNLQVQNLLDMTRLQSGEAAPRLEWHVLEEVVGASLARSRELLSGREVKVSLPHDLPLLRLDAGLIEKLFTNLLENAADHTPPGTPIQVTAQAGPAMIEVIVSDSGPGIPPGEEAAIFERFARGGDRGRGLGLGLAICQAIARLHGGRIWARNGDMGGAEFHIEFPRPADQPEVPVG